MDVMFYEVFEEEETAIKGMLANNIKAGFSQHTVQASGDTQLPAKLISIRTQSIIPEKWIDSLDGVLSRSAGFDHLTTIKQQSNEPISCGYLPSYCARAVAEQAVLMMLSLMRKLPQQIKQFNSFNRDGITGSECGGKTILIVGVGRIGSELARISLGLGMRVLGVDLVKRLKDIKYVSLKEGVKVADVIVCALPLTSLTRGLLNFEMLSSIKPSTILINIARGEIIPIEDLKKLLDKNKISGIALDVYEDEPVIADNLRKHKQETSLHAQTLLSIKSDDRVLTTPHNAFNTQESVERKAEQTCKAVNQFVSEGTFPDPIPNEE